MNATEIYEGIVKIYGQGNASGNGTEDSLKMLTTQNITINILSILILFLTMVSLGCAMEISKIKGHCIKPKGAAIAMVAQFGIMPLTAYSLAKILQMSDIKAVTLLICGCCPGGTLSNIFSLAMKGDMNLSIVLTTCSSFAALAFMPLLLLIYSQGFSGLENAVPYVNIITTLVLTLVPCALGIAIKHYKPTYSSVIQKVGFSILVISSVLAIFLCGAAIRDILWTILTPANVTAGALMPMIGYTLGYAMSVLLRLDAQCGRTIAMETGCQNIQLCFAILKVAFPLEVIGPMFLFPLIYMTFQIAEAFLLILVFRGYQTLAARAREKHEYANADIGPEVKQP